MRRRKQYKLPLNKKKERIPWSETPAGKAHEQEQADYAAWVASGGPEKIDPALCFTCQEKPPTQVAKRGKTEFKLCDDCAPLVQSMDKTRNDIKRALGRGRGGDIFRMCLGADLLPSFMTFRRL